MNEYMGMEILAKAASLTDKQIDKALEAHTDGELFCADDCPLAKYGRSRCEIILTIAARGRIKDLERQVERLEEALKWGAFAYLVATDKIDASVADVEKVVRAFKDFGKNATNKKGKESNE